MSNRAMRYVVMIVVPAVSALISAPLFATDPAWSLSLGPSAVPFVSGSAGSGASAPDYGDVFDTGYGFQLEVARSLSPRIAVAGGLAYQSNGGKTFQGFEFEDLDASSIYVGGRYRLVERPSWSLAALVDVGSARLPAVDVTFADTTVRYWESSWVLLWDVGLEVSFHGRGPWRASVRAAYRDIGKPDAAFGEPSEGGSMGSVPVSVLAGYSF